MSELLLDTPRSEVADRTEAFRAHARRRADGAVLTDPLVLPEELRRLYVRRTLLEDHQFRIRNRHEGAQAKFEKLAAGLFSFFRGTALLYYRDYAGLDMDLPIVFTLGDVHPENFGVMPSEDGAPVFGVNDFDEGGFAPFSYDLRRGATGFWIAAREEGFSKKKSTKITRAFVRGYFDGIVGFARGDREKHHAYRLDNSPSLIADLIEDAIEERKDFLEEYIHLMKLRFRATDELVPRSKRVDDLQAAINAYVENNQITVPRQHDGYFRVHDVAVKRGSGTASLGLDRYWVLIHGEGEHDDDCRILELKQARRTVLYGLVPDHSEDNDGKAEFVAQAQNVHLVGGDPFYGYADLDGTSFLVRERSPYKDDIDLGELDKADFITYAEVCGKALAQPHARSDAGTGILQGDAERKILKAVSRYVFTDDVVRFAKMAAKRVKQDFKLFKKDFKLGAYDLVDA